MDDLYAEFLSLNLIGQSPEFCRVLRLIKKIAQYDVPVLICGETGTGKEMAARAIHYLSDRKQCPFIPVDCGAIPENLVENELFGHERGAFTDAKYSQTGLIQQAEGGTLFLDEVDALSAKAQVALLRFLQSREFRSLGSQNISHANVRILTATNNNLNELVKKGHFREDLLFRLDVLSMELPPLRQRTHDSIYLANYFLEKFHRQYNVSKKVLHADSIRWIENYHWPGNVRELENALHKAFLLSDGYEIYISADKKNEANVSHTVLWNNQICISIEQNFNEAKSQFLKNFEEQYLHKLMVASRGNITEAAKRCGKERRSLGKLLKKYGINRQDYSR